MGIFCSQTLFIFSRFAFSFLTHSNDKKQATNGYKYNSEGPYGILHGCGKGYSQCNNDNSHENVSLVFLQFRTHMFNFKSCALSADLSIKETHSKKLKTK